MFFHKVHPKSCFYWLNRSKLAPKLNQQGILKRSSSQIVFILGLKIWAINDFSLKFRFQRHLNKNYLNRVTHEWELLNIFSTLPLIIIVGRHKIGYFNTMKWFIFIELSWSIFLEFLLFFQPVSIFPRESFYTVEKSTTVIYHTREQYANWHNLRKDLV